MQPDSIETRMNRVETDMATVKQQLTDLAGDVKVVPALMESMAELKVAMQYVQRDQGDVKTAIGTLNQHIEVQERERRSRDQARQQGEDSRRWQGYAMAVSLIVVFLAIMAQIIITLATGGS